MQSNADIQKITQIVYNIVQKNDNTAQIYLFGSRARGDAHADSDWDILVISGKEKMNFTERTDLMYDIGEAGENIGQQINALVYTAKQWESAPPSLFKFNVQHEAIKL